MLCIDVFGTPPLITVEDARELSIESEAGFIRAAGAALRGATLLSAKARKGDRLVRLTFGTRSRFGVGDESELYVEFVPRFGNIVLVRKERIVAALKEFSLAENATRAVQIGHPYALPPLLARTHSRRRPNPGPDASVLDHLNAFRAQSTFIGESYRTEHRRKALIKRLDERERKVRKDLESVAQKAARRRGSRSTSRTGRGALRRIARTR